MFLHKWRALLACASIAAVLATPTVAQADVLNDWNVIAQSQTIPLRPTAHGQTRGIAMVQGAVYDAVNALDPDYEPYLLDLAARQLTAAAIIEHVRRHPEVAAINAHIAQKSPTA